MRLDRYLVEYAFAETRSKAQRMIEEGSVKVDGAVATKAAMEIVAQQVEVENPDRYVSRAAHKLEGFLPMVPFEVAGMEALDIGSSTGGFVQVLLAAGAVSVDAVDVGTDQLHPTLREDPRVRSFERTDIRRFEPGRTYELVTSDVSFISLTHVLDDIDRLASRWIVVLFKPQFEVGREARRDRRGVVTDAAAVARAKARFEAACAALGWRRVVDAPASITGKEGNRETCYCYEKC